MTKWPKCNYSNLDTNYSQVWSSPIHYTIKIWNTKIYLNTTCLWVFVPNTWHFVLGSEKHSPRCFHEDWKGWRFTSWNLEHQICVCQANETFMGWDILGTKIEQKNLNIEMQAIVDYHDFEIVHGRYVFITMFFSNLCSNYVSCVLCILGTITKDQFVTNVIEFQ